MGPDAPDVGGVAVEPLVLIVEDDPSLAELLRYTIGQNGFRTALAAAGTEAVRMARRQRPHLVLLDLALPGLSGLEVCRTLRRHPPTRDLPVITLSVLDDEATKVQGLDAGADDYVVKPFSPAELVARMRAVLRRSGARPAEQHLLPAGAVTLDPAARTVRCGDQTLDLSSTAFALLRHFLGHPGRVFSREQLRSAVWGPGCRNDPRSIDVTVYRLRKALEDAGAGGSIRSVRAAGYVFDL
jgi:two-component system, OmpR family, phosphate regulon response regulator PhoB